MSHERISALQAVATAVKTLHLSFEAVGVLDFSAGELSHADAALFSDCMEREIGRLTDLDLACLVWLGTRHLRVEPFNFMAAFAAFEISKRRRKAGE